MSLELLQSIALNVGGPAGGAFLAVRYALARIDLRIDSNVSRLGEHGKRLNRHDTRLDEAGNRITRVETRLDFHDT